MATELFSIIQNYSRVSLTLSAVAADLAVSDVFFDGATATDSGDPHAFSAPGPLRIVATRSAFGKGRLWTESSIASGSLGNLLHIVETSSASNSNRED